MAGARGRRRYGGLRRFALSACAAAAIPPCGAGDVPPSAGARPPAPRAEARLSAFAARGERSEICLNAERAKATAGSSGRWKEVCFDGVEMNAPLIVDLDGTLSKSDGLVDAFVTTALRRPSQLGRATRALARSRYAFKMALAESYAPHAMPLRAELLDYIRAQKAAGREVHLVTASPQAVADAVAQRVGLFDSAVGSSDGVNLKGAAKADYLRRRFPDGFVYAGDDKSDLDVWRHAAGVVTVAASDSVAQAAQALGVAVERRFPREPADLGVWLRQLRLHQWSKNLLLFAPLALAHRYGDLHAALRVALGFLCMGLFASATYIVNDLSDLEADRLHATKRTRPLAAARITAAQGAGAAAGLAGVALVGGALLDPLFALCLLTYGALTLSYSLRLKAYALVDVFALGLLYTLRVLMGMALIGSAMSPWLLVFSAFFFFSLSIAKRHVEIERALASGATGPIKGRGYLPTDAPLTLALGVASGCFADMVLFLYVTEEAFPAGAYGHPQFLWAIAFFVFLWMSRIWLKAHRGELDDDPIYFALRDRPSLALAALSCASFALASL